ncbi:LPXTG-domain-containing protein cell wall anchor domain protein [Enterococcus casseliflavus EC20]|uniref:LPXTG-domain-containing protein cell wall anchor domain protein n=1 Tax=Enterococcus casseliflavus EC20 TaxID=565655 RepID=M9T896_ENTCA|nr:MucBP domain-containing protein [Enterococcus casseliflavus]AGJ01167.1 LPXTG-domain-containing protein cell wall anchor domain protein [Enterococcus casseliflavus EC20]
MKKSAKQELLSRLLVSSSVFILGSPIVTQAVVSIPAAAETISTSEIEEATLSTSENLSEQQVSESAVTEETTTSETGSKEKAVEQETEQETVETTQVEETESDQRTEQSAENASTEEDTESSMAADESQEVKSALAENILWTGMWGTAPATLDIEGVLTVGAGTLTTAVDQVIPLTEELKNMVIKKVVLTAPVILPADVPGLFESTSHDGKVPSELEEIVGLTFLDTSQATTMNNMFYGFRGSSLDLSNFDSSSVISSLGAGMNEFLGNALYLKELKLGPNFSFVGWKNSSSNPYPVNLSEPSDMYGFHSSYYTGYWQNVGNGTVDAPYGDYVYSSKDLVMSYDGASMADTYVWQPHHIEAAPVTVNYLDEDGNELLPPNVLIGGNIGDTVEVVPEDIPNYTLKEVHGDEKVVFSKVPQTVTYIYSPLIETKEERKIVARIIHYLHEDGTEAAPDHLDTVEFTREIRTNLATGEETLGEWQARDDDTTFDLVKSPEIANYYTDREFIDEVMDVKADSEDIEEFVIYSPKMVESTETKEVKRMIHYVYEDGKEAASDNVDTVTFTRTVTMNEATGDKTFGEWQAKDDDTTFDEVSSPEIDKYNADQKTVDKVTGLTAESEDLEVTVTYSPNMIESTETKEVKQTIHYVYEDGKQAAPDKTDTVTFTRTVTTNEATGDKTFGEWQAKDDDTTFDEVQSPEIKNYHADKTSIEEVTGLTAEDKDREVTITYSPNMIESTETKEVKQTIHYMYEDGKEAASDNVDTVTFTRTVTTNEATGDKTFGEWQAKDDDTTFDEVESPEIKNYHADKTSIDKVTGLTAEDKDRESTVTYSPNMTESTETKEVKQTIRYFYEDGKQAAPDKLDTVTFTRTVTTNEATGDKTFGEWQAKDDDTTFDEVQSPEIKNYHADKTSIEEVTGLTANTKDSEVTVTYSPNMTKSTETKEVKQTIHYVYEDSKQAAPDTTDTVTFTRTVTTNEATGDKTFGEWQAKDDDTTFDEVESPEIKNYHADKTSIDKVTGLTAEDKDREVTITYSPNMVESTETKEVKQTIHYVYEDSKEAAPDKVDTVTFTRTVTTNEATGDKTFGQWQAKDDDTTFDEVKSPEIDKYNADQKTVDKVTGLTAESENREVTVTYSPNMIESTETKEVKQTIHYVYADGKKAAPDNVDTVTFTRTVTTNEATGKNTYGEWQAKDDDTTFDEVSSPEIKNYHADKTSIDKVTGLTAEDKDREVTITYSPNMVESTETKEVKQTIHYVYEDSKQAAPDKTDTVTFTRTVTTNEATGDKTFGEWQAKDDDTTFDEVNSPEIDKYNADQKTVDKVTGLTAESEDREVTVTYSPNMIESTETKEVKQTIRYVYADGKQAAPDKLDTVTFTRTVTTNEATGDKTFGEWQAKDDDTTFDEVSSPEIDKYNADQKTVDKVVELTAESEDREVTVTYSPNMIESTETKEVKQTIHYVYEDGKEAAPDKLDTVTFTRTVTTNEATGDKTFGEWQAKDDDTTFDEMKSPEIKNYHADKTSIDEVTGLTAESEDLKVTVTYSPNMTKSTETKEIKQTIHYMYEDGKEAAPDKVDTVTFKRTVTTNEATGDKTFGEWQAKNNDTTFDAVKSKNIDGYTADVTTVKEQTGLTVEDEDRELTVTYIKNPTDPTDPSKEPSNTPNDQTNPEATTSSTDKEPTTKVPETTKTATSEKILPKTGEQATPYGLYGGVALVVASLLGLFMKRSKRKSE